MKITLAKVFATALIAASINAQAAVHTHANTILVENPTELPEAAQSQTIAIYLHQTSAGEADLYLEQNGGKQLAILNVTDPAAIKTVSEVQLNAKAPFDFVRDLGDSAALIRYRDHSGVAVLNLRRPHQPTLSQAAQALDADLSTPLGSTGMLLEGSAAPHAAEQNTSYSVVDLTGPAAPVLLASIPAVSQSIVRPETGTTFMLNAQGLTVIRRIRVEQEYRNEQIQMEHN